MKPPCELMVKTFLPATRGLLAHRLKSLGLDQDKIASLLGVTQAAVSYYLSTNTKSYTSKLIQMGVSEEQVDSMISELTTAVQKSDSYATEVLYNHWRLLLSSGALCSAHRKLVGGLKECDMCLRLMSAVDGGRERFNVLKALREATALLEASPTFSGLIPEVYSNLVYSVENPKDEGDVAGIPGRILRVKGRAKATMDPEFGASTHMAKVVLHLRKRNPWVRAAINTKYDSTLLEALQRVYPAKVETLGSYVGLQEFFGKLAQVSLEPPVGFIVDSGSVGVEPNIYIVGSDPLTVANIAVSASTIWFHNSKRVVS
ncbi:MAG: thiamine-phosphate synthase family protein [Thermoprotei archaeon]